MTDCLQWRGKKIGLAELRRLELKDTVETVVG
jgi:hypothetical protein